MVTRDFLPVVEQPAREPDRSLPSAFDVKNEWSYTFTAKYVRLLGVVLS
jgi:hypothetical protein